MVGSVPNSGGGAGVSPESGGAEGGFSNVGMVSPGRSSTPALEGSPLRTAILALGSTFRFLAAVGFTALLVERLEATLDFDRTGLTALSSCFNALSFRRASFAIFFAALNALRARFSSTFAASDSPRKLSA